MTSTQIDDETLLTSHEVGALLQVNPSSVNKWVNAGLIPAFRTPGGHRRIRTADLLTFLDAHKMPVPQQLRRVERQRLLLVDDDAKQLVTLARVFTPHAAVLDVRTADNGIDALLLLGSFKPHVVLLDVYMPELDGIEVCRRLKANPLTSGIAVLITSAQLDDDVEKRALEAGAKRCLHKPVDIAQVLSHLALPPRAEP